MTNAKQLTIDGKEVPAENLLGRRGQHPLTPVQRAVLRHLAVNGEIRSVEAGMILYEHVMPSEAQIQYRRKYASADGLEVMKRLMKRGLVRRLSPGVWVSTSEPL